MCGDRETLDCFTGPTDGIGGLVQTEPGRSDVEVVRSV